MKRRTDPGRGLWARLGAAPAPAAWLRATVLAFSAAALWWPLTLGSGVCAGASGALLAALAGDAYGRVPRRGARLRAGSVIVLALAVSLVSVGFARFGVATALLPALVGPIPALRVSEAILALGLTAPTVFVLRWLAVRRPALATLEIAVVAAAFATGLAAHREGMVHRPHAVGDLAWSHGLDPTVLFLLLGGACVLLLAALLVSEERRRRIPLHLSALALVALALVFFVRLSGLPQPRPAEDLGLTGEGEEQADARESGASGRGAGDGSASELGDIPFKNEYGSGGGQAPVAVVLLHDDYSPPSGVYYFRQSVFSRYNGRRLVQASRDDVDLDVVPRFPAERIELAWVPPASAQRRPLLTTTGLLRDHVRPFALDSPASLEPRPNPEGMRFRRTYQATSLVQTLPYGDLVGHRAGAADWSDSQWEYYTEAPGDPRYLETAREATAILKPGFAGDPLARALAVKLYLDKNGIYSRRSGHADADDPTASFLFGDLTGYCVHFAHAAVFLLRSLGVPARVAAGYAVPESDRAGGSAIMIRGLNAHAWPEVFLEDVGWVTVDPAPERSLEAIAPHPDEQLQSMLGEILRRGGSREVYAGLEPSPLPSLEQIAAWLLGALVLALAWGFAVKLYRALAPALAPGHALPRVSYRAALDVLAEAGLSRRFGESRERFAERARALAPSFLALTGAHLRAAFGGAGDADAAQLRRLPSAVRRERRTRVSRARRWLGALDPFAWLRAR